MRLSEEQIRRFEASYAPVAPAIYAWAGVQLRPSLRALVDPDDILQEVCVRAFSRFADFDEARAPFRTWIFGIAYNVFREALREAASRADPREGRGPSSKELEALPASATSISLKAARSESVHRFLETASRLDEDERKLILYRGLEGLSHDEVGEAMGVAGEVANKRWQRLRKKILASDLPRDFLID